MKLLRREFLRLAASAAAFPAMSHIASAQAYPTKAIKLIVPVTPGSPVDALRTI
jgi:tripartite-type tricarboxylate transporter receptor subunit TctC